MMTNTQEHEVNRRGIRITVVLLALVALGLYLGPMIMKVLPVSFIFSAVLIGAGNAAFAGSPGTDWPQWRGPQREWRGP